MAKRKNVTYYLAGRGGAQPYDHMRAVLQAATRLAKIYPTDTIQIRMVVHCGDQTTRHVIWDSSRIPAGPPRSGNSVPTI